MNEASAPATPRRLRVLVVDPDPEIRTRYERSFVMAGFDVAQAADGREALTKALVHPPSLVVMELRLPLIDAFALCEILRRDRATARTPILVVTAETQPGDLERIRSVGADDVLPKSIAPDVLAQRVGQLVAASDDSAFVQGGSRFAAPDSDQSFTPAARHRRTSTATTRRELTTVPPLPPPALSCPSCDRALTYRVSHTGGVSQRHSEQWDYFSCWNCGGFQYRHRTGKVRRLDESEEEWLQRQRESGEWTGPERRQS
jgi:DNA-binding response OmpR family regulator